MCWLRRACLFIEEPEKLELPAGELVARGVAKSQCLSTGHVEKQMGHFLICQDTKIQILAAKEVYIINAENAPSQKSKIIECRAKLWMLGIWVGSEARAAS